MKVLDTISKLKSCKISYKNSFNRYAVFAPIIDIKEEAHLLFEVRSNSITTQPGEISFPGGKIEEGESWREAALRETCEELQIKPSSLEWVSDLNIANISNSRIVYTGIGLLKERFENLIPNQAEVAELFVVPLKYFINNEPELYQVATEIKPPPNFPYNLIPNGKDYNWRGRSYEVPFYTFDKRIIWGLTARIVIDIVNRLS